MTIRELSQYRSLLIELQNDIKRVRMRQCPKCVEEALLENISSCEKDICNILKFIKKIRDSNLRDIIKLKFIDGYSWEKVATQRGTCGDGSTERKQVLRYLEKCG